MWALLLQLSLAKPPSTDADAVDAQWRAMQVLRVRPEAYRIIKEPITIERGPVKLVLEEGVMVPVFSGFHDRDRDGIRQAKAEAFLFDSKAPPPLEEGQVEFVGFVFSAAKGHWEVNWQERADALIFANHQVSNLRQDPADWVDVAHGAPWTGVVSEGFVLDASEEVEKAFLGPEAPPDASPYDVVVYGERDYGPARLRARMLFHDRREAMMKDGFHPGRGVAWDRVARLHGLQTRGEHSLIDLHIDQNTGDPALTRVLQPGGIDWVTLRQDWTGAMDSRRHSQLTAFDVDIHDRWVKHVITGVPFPPTDPEDPTSPPLPSARIETEQAYVVVQPYSNAAQFRVEVMARLSLKAVGGDFSVLQLQIPRSACHQHDWKLLGIDRIDGVPLISRSPLIEYNEQDCRAGPAAQREMSGLGSVPIEANVASPSDGGGGGESTGIGGAGQLQSYDAVTAPGVTVGAGQFDVGAGSTAVDVVRNRPESRVTLALPEPLREGQTLVMDVRWKDVWPMGNPGFEESGNLSGGISVQRQSAPASGPHGVLPRPAGSSRDQPAKFQIEVVIPQRENVFASSSGATVKEWVAEGYIHQISAQLDQPVPWVDVNIGKFHAHNEPAAKGFPAIRAMTFNKEDGRQLAAESRAEMNFLQGFLGPYPWPEFDISLGPGGVNTGVVRTNAHGMTGMGISGVTDVVYGARDAGGATTQLGLAHSLAHQWFGQSVRPAHQSDAWFTETFAEAFATVYSGALHDNYDRIYRNKRIPFENPLSAPVARVSLVGAYEHPLENAILLSYGPYVFQEMLRPRIGMEAYHAALDGISRDFAGKALTTEQIQRWFEIASGEDLSDFFDFWVYGGFVPRRVVLRWEWTEGILTVQVETDVPFGRFDVPVVVDGVPHMVDVVDSTGTLEIPLEAEPEKVELDPEHRILTRRRVTRKGLDAEIEPLPEVE